MAEKQRVCLSLDKDTVKKMKDVKEETGLPLSKQVELKMKGYEVKKKD